MKSIERMKNLIRRYCELSRHRFVVTNIVHLLEQVDSNNTKTAVILNRVNNEINRVGTGILNEKLKELLRIELNNLAKELLTQED